MNDAKLGSLCDEELRLKLSNATKKTKAKMRELAKEIGTTVELMNVKMVGGSRNKPSVALSMKTDFYNPEHKLFKAIKEKLHYESQCSAVKSIEPDKTIKVQMSAEEASFARKHLLLREARRMGVRLNGWHYLIRNPGKMTEKQEKFLKDMIAAKRERNESNL